MDIKLSKDVETRLLASAQRYLSELGLEAGSLKAQEMLRFVLVEFGPAIYNQAVADARDYMSERVADLENVCFADEKGYWDRAGKAGVRRLPLRR